MTFGHLLPQRDGGGFFSQCSQSLGEGHEGIAVVMLCVFGNDPFEEWPGLGGLFLTQQALCKVGSGIDVLRVPFERRAITGLSLFQFALLEIDVAELRVVMRLVEMVNLSLELLDAAAIESAGQFEAASSGWRSAV